MYKIKIFSDPHLGLVRRAHTVASSRKALTEKLNESALSCIATDDSTVTICGGDLFDKSHNDEETILNGMLITASCDIVLAGNHDVPNREDSTCSIELVYQAISGKSRVRRIDVGDSQYYRDLFEDLDLAVFSVPHHSSQQLFDETIENLLTTVELMNGLEIVVLHCNYECGYADNEISLNLTSEQVDKLLNRFDYIFIGHEHESRVLKDGRLIITGNTHPTSFSDISDKFIWYIDNYNEIIKKKIWDKSKGYCEFDIKSQSPPSAEDDYKFISVEGNLTPEEYANVADFMVKLWKDNPQAFMIRNNVQVIEDDSIDEVGLTEIDDLPSHIAEELKDNDSLRATWESYFNRI